VSPPTEIAALFYRQRIVCLAQGWLVVTPTISGKISGKNPDALYIFFSCLHGLFPHTPRGKVVAQLKKCKTSSIFTQV
jgi:hypothetical protein